MKIINSIKTNFLLFLLIIYSLSLWNSCSVSNVPLEILVPAQIDVSKNIKNIGIVNRSLPRKSRKFVNFLEGFISGESILSDRIASGLCLTGLAETLNNSPRFNAVVISGENQKGTGTRRFPLPLDWNSVERLCRKYRVDALIALETFDSNIFIDFSKRKVKKTIKDKKTKKKIKITTYVYDADLNIDVNSGWRIYDPSAHSIIDMNVYRDRKTWSYSGNSRREARHGLPSKREAVNQSGFFSGYMYAMRISPTWINVNRDFYIKGSPELKEAKRYVRKNDWDKAIEIWEGILTLNNDKISGRAAYNLAFAYEVKNNFNSAYKWAKIAYEKYGNRRALNYIHKIRERISDKYKLEKQLD